MIKASVSSITVFLPLVPVIAHPIFLALGKLTQADGEFNANLNMTRKNPRLV